MTKRAIIAAAFVAAGVVAVYGVYQFQTNRMTPGRLKAMALAKERVARAEQAENAPAEEAADKKADDGKIDYLKVFKEYADSSEKRPEPPLKLDKVGETPASFNVEYHTTEGDFVINYKTEWSPMGVDRIYKLVKTGYYDNSIFFRAVTGFVVQWGIADTPAKTKEWIEKLIPAEQPKASNSRGKVTFAMGRSPATRSVQLFINLGDNSFLDEMGFAPVGEVVQGMDVVEKLNSNWAERPTKEQGSMVEQGNAFLDEKFPGLDRIIWADVVKDVAPAPAAAETVPAPAPAPASAPVQGN